MGHEAHFHIKACNFNLAISPFLTFDPVNFKTAFPNIKHIQNIYSWLL